ncbi:MAG: antibiotic biosynthesis monooxygenase [Ignavibacteriaceae bacterium]|nr:antibiotic biosynthesis monooxygenase [Ignavibacteriaceae bacterium]
MAKVIFSIQYEVQNDKRDDFINSLKELKSLLKADGLESYSLFEGKTKNHFQEVYQFSSKEAFDNFDDSENERIDILISKIEDLKEPNSTKYYTFYEVLL